MKNAWIDDRRARGAARRGGAARGHGRAPGGVAGRYERQPLVGVRSHEQTTRGAAAGRRAGAGRGHVIQGSGRGAGNSDRHAHQPPGARARRAGRRTRRLRRELRRRNPDGLRRRRARRAQRAEIAAAIERDPALARASSSIARCAPRWRARFPRVLDQPVPERLLAAAQGADAHAGYARRQGAAVSGARRARARDAVARARMGRDGGERGARRGDFVETVCARDPAPIVARSGGALVARGALATALDSATRQYPAWRRARC